MQPSALGHKYHRHFSKIETDRYSSNLPAMRWEAPMEPAVFSERQWLWTIVIVAAGTLAWTLTIQYCAGVIG